MRDIFSICCNYTFQLVYHILSIMGKVKVNILPCWVAFNTGQAMYTVFT